MADVSIEYSHTDPQAHAAIIQLIKESGYLPRIMLAMPSDQSAVDGSSFWIDITSFPKHDLPNYLTDALVVSDAALTVSHDLGVGRFIIEGTPEAIFGVKSLLDALGFRYVMRSALTGVTTSDISGVTEL